MKIINIKDYANNITKRESKWFDENLVYGGWKNPKRPDLERGILLYSICKKIKAKYCLDIGTATYFSAKSMAKYRCKVDTIDNEPKLFGKNEELMPKIVSYIYDSKELLPKFIKEERRYDLIFIDGDHSYEGVKADIINSMKLSDIIVCHDYRNIVGVTKAIDEIIKPSYYIIEDRMWFNSCYENGIDRNGKKIDYGICIFDKFNKLGKGIK